MEPGRRRRVVSSALIVVALLAACLSLAHLSPYRPGAKVQYLRASVVSLSQAPAGMQSIRAQLLDGPRPGRIVSVERATGLGDAAYDSFHRGSKVLLVTGADRAGRYGFAGRWYMPGTSTLFALLLVLVVAIGAWRGVTSMLGLALSVVILSAFVVPRIVAGHDAFATCIEASFAITLVSIFVAHGVTKRSAVALASSLALLAVVVGLTVLATHLSSTSEVIGDSSVGLFFAAHPIDRAGLVTGGVVIASLGTIFDITTGQAAVVDEVYLADRTQTVATLFWKGMSVGREHIAALVNTLALVYAGVALPTIVSAVVNAQSAASASVPLVVRLDTEAIAEEVVRICVASLALLLALPLTTFLAACVLPRWKRADSLSRLGAPASPGELSHHLRAEPATSPS